jgi:hypothetical protein
MGIFPEMGNYIYPTSKDGSPVVVTVVGEMKRIQSNNPKLTYKDKNKNDLKYFDVLPVVDEEGNEVELKISTWKVYFALKALNPEIGDTIQITHPKNGEYTIVKK